MRLPSRQAGFTLIELSIVLVIIGLIVGGVLVGRDLIRAAEIQATISQVEQLKAAVNAFKTKYNALPGDIQAQQAAAFGFAARTGGPGDGDGDGFISDCHDGQDGDLTQELGCETVFFWTDLSAAGLVKGGFSQIADVSATTTQVGQYLPEAKTGNAFLIVYSYDNNWASHASSHASANYIELAPIQSVWSGVISSSLTYPLTPVEAFSIDQKIDDGIPVTGKVRSTQGCLLHCIQLPGPAEPSFVPAPGNCINFLTSPYTYSPFNSKACGLQIDAGF